MGPRSPFNLSQVPQSKGPNWLAMVVALIALLLMLALYSSSCAPPPNFPGEVAARPEYGQTQVEEVVSYKGQPSTETVIPVAGAGVTAAVPGASTTAARVLEYPDDENIQVEDNVVVARFRPPRGKERQIQYWRIRFAKDFDRSESVSAALPGHGSEKRPLSSPLNGETVLFDGSSGRVLRVVEHAKSK